MKRLKEIKRYGNSNVLNLNQFDLRDIGTEDNPAKVGDLVDISKLKVIKKKEDKEEKK